MFAVTAAEFTAEGTANILGNCFILLWGCPSTLLSDNGLQFCAQLATAVSKLFGVHKLTTSAYNSSGNGGVERVNYTMAQMLTMVCNGTKMIGIHTFLMLSTPTITLSTPQQASLPMKFISNAYRSSPSPSSTALTAEFT